MRKKEYPFSISQEDSILIAYATSKKATDMHRLGIFFTVNENPNIEALEKSFNHLLEVNDALRIKCHFTIKGIRQYVDDYKYIKIPVVLLDNEKELEEKMAQERKLDEVFSNKPLYKAIIYTYNNKATLFMCIHHITCDGYSIGLIYKLLGEYYKAYSNNETPVDNKIDYSIETFLQDEVDYVRSKKHKEDIAYWRDNIYSRKSFSFIMPAIRSRDKVKWTSIIIDKDRYTKVLAYCKSVGISVSSFISSITALAINQNSKKDDFCFFNMNHGRMNYKQKQTIGNIIFTFLNFYHIDTDDSISNFMKSSYMNYLQSMKHAHASVLDVMVHTLRTELRLLRFNYFGLIFSYINFNNFITNHDYEYGVLPYNYQPNQLYCMVSDDGVSSITMNISYQPRKIKEEKMEIMKDSFNMILDKVISDNYINISELY